MLSRGSSFTYQDVLDELIVYTQSGAAAQTDEFGFSLTDGLYTQAGRLEFSMELPRKQPPTLAVSRDLQLAAGTGTGMGVALLGAAGWSSLNHHFTGLAEADGGFAFSGAGSAARLTAQHLKAAAGHSGDTAIRFVLRRDPSRGQLQLTTADSPVQISAKGPLKSFTQADINKGESAGFWVVTASI